MQYPRIDRDDNGMFNDPYVPGRKVHPGEKYIGIWQWATRLRSFHACDVCGVVDKAKCMNAIIVRDVEPNKFSHLYLCAHCWNDYAGDD